MSSDIIIARVALPLALAQPLAYEVPADLAGRIVPGHRVKVPLRGRSAHGFVLAVEPAPAADVRHPLRPLIALDPKDVILDEVLLGLVHWLAGYYVAPIGMALETAVPRSVARPPRKSCEPAAMEPAAGRFSFTLNAEQSSALAAISRAVETGGATTFLLQGVTGSGKTEVYLRAADVALGRGKTVLFLVPEIALGTQLVERVRNCFGSKVAEFHSQLAAAERKRSWWAARRGDVRVIVGARSAVFAPLRDLGLIVVDEEHEPAYKQGETPRYHGRDTALMRARLSNAVTVLGSATPSLETRANARAGKYVRLVLPERIDSRPTPIVTLVDLRARGCGGEAPIPPADLAVVPGVDAETGEPLSTYLLDRLRTALAAGDQAILFLNRRGFATVVQCRDCGHVFECPHCSVVLTYHRLRNVLRCHYCNHRVLSVEVCPGCGGSRFSYGGAGTQRLEAALGRHLPGVRVLRMDLDSTRGRGAHARMIATFERGEADVLLGTQMVAKGFDFPRVTLVGVINADREMSLPDFRGQERAFQLLTQVAGRAGRGSKPGEVVFQTYLPDHHVIRAAGLQDYERFFEREMEERRGLAYPPFRRMANVLIDGPDEASVIRRAQEEADRLLAKPGLRVLGPAPMPLSRLKGQYRWHVTILSTRAALLGHALSETIIRATVKGRSGRIRVQADMDPVSML